MPAKVKFDTKNMDVLLSSERRRTLDTHRLLSLLPIHLHHVVADIGCGPGYFTLPLAKFLLYGKVYALDIRDEMLEALRLRVAESHLANVEIAKCGATEFPLPNESLDGVFLSLVTQEVRDRAAFLKAVRDLLRQRGWCAILEWFESDEPDENMSAPPVKDPNSPKDLESLVRSVGFRLEFIRILSGGYYMAQMRR